MSRCAGLWIEAMARADGDDFAVAVLDFSLGAETASPVARRLARRGVPFLFYTGNPAQGAGLDEWSLAYPGKTNSPERAGVRGDCSFVA